MSNNPALADGSAATIGQTSAEIHSGEEQAESKSFWQRLLSMSIYETMLLVSLICVSTALILLLFNIRRNFEGLAFPWHTETGAIQTTTDQ